VEADLLRCLAPFRGVPCERGLLSKNDPPSLSAAPIQAIQSAEKFCRFGVLQARSKSWMFEWVMLRQEV